MRAVMSVLTRLLSGVVAMLTLAACGTPAPTTGSAPATEFEASAASVIIRGSVVDSANRPVANAQVTCASPQCTLLLELGAAHHTWVQGTATNASGSYEMRVRAGQASFLVSASARGYETQLREARLPNAACRWDQPGCSISLSFTLPDLAD